MKNRRNLIIYTDISSDYTGSRVYDDDEKAKMFYDRLISSGRFSRIEWFGREFDSYELEVSNENS